MGSSTKPASRARVASRLPFVLSVVSHAVACYWIAADHVTRGTSRRALPNVASATEVEIESPIAETVRTEIGPTEAAPEPARTRRQDAAALLGHASDPRSPSRSSSEPQNESGGVVTSSEAGEGAWTFAPTTAPPTGVDPLSKTGLGAATQQGIQATLKQLGAEEREHARQIPTYTERDIGLGIAPGGAIASLAEEIVRRSRVPVEGSARLQVDCDASGRVTAARVLDSASGYFEWLEVCADLVAQAGSKPPLAVPAHARGLSLVIDVTTAMRTVDGAPPPPPTTVTTALLDPLGTLTKPLPRPPLVHVVKARTVEVTPF